MMITTKKSATNNSNSNSNSNSSSSSSACSNNNDTTTTISTRRNHQQQQQQHQQNSPTLTTRRRGGGVRTSNGLLWTKTNISTTNTHDTTKLQQYPTKKCPWYNLLFPILVLLVSCSWILFVVFVLIYHHHHHHDTATTSIINNYNPSHSTTTTRKNSAASRDFHEKMSSSSITNTAKTQLRTSTASITTTSSSTSSSSSRSKVTAKMTQTISTTSSTLAPNLQPRIDYTNNRNNNNNNTGTNTLLRLEEAKKIPLTPLRHPIDYEKYTIRMNTWKRNEQLLISLNHHASCQGVAQIQVVWCNSEEDPPPSILYHPSGKVVVERHTVNSLNERFHILPTTHTPTIGILSLDDDVLRPCQAWDSGKFQKINIIYFFHISKKKEKRQNLNFFRRNYCFSVFLIPLSLFHFFL
jgi:hypothetical protein